QVRLVNYGSRCAGRVEVFHNKRWGTVCDDNWDLLDAEVVCRQLGCGRALSAPGAGQFGRGDGIIWMDETNCTGLESTLSACRARPWGINNCYHGEDAGVVCSGDQCSFGVPPHVAVGGGSAVSSFSPVQLVDGPGRCAGRVEVFHNEKWGTVCDDSWDFADAKVVCRQLDCGTVVSAPRRAHFGQGQGPIWLDNVRCTGSEAALSECRTKGWGVHACSHAEDAGVVCSETPHASGDLVRPLGKGRSTVLPATGQVFLARIYCLILVLDLDPGSSEALRLVNGPHHCAGRVEVFHNHQWGTICDDGWDLKDAAVVCRQLGCGTAVSAPGLSGFGQGSGPIWLDGVNCLGTEATLAECPMKPWGHHACNHVEDASVVCSGCNHPQGVNWWKGSSAAPSALQNPLWLRLVGGLSECAGRVEVFYNNEWGTVCDDSWDLRDAAVVCRQLGCGVALSAPSSARFGWGHGPIWLDNVSCTGEESDFSECQAKTWGMHNCYHGEDAGVVC
ncbi:Deleted in malignant brain tumors 1 protein, partial [Egretta garzetta]